MPKQFNGGGGDEKSVIQILLGLYTGKINIKAYLT